MLAVAPQSIEKSVTKEWIKILTRASEFSGVSGKKSPWNMADLALSVVKRWSNHPNYNLDELAKTSRISASRLKLLASLADFFPPQCRVKQLSLSHHIAAMRGDPTRAAFWLDQARTHGWNSEEIRLAIDGDGDPKKYSWLRCGTVWHFSSCDSRFGIKYPGRIPGQIAANVIHYFSQPGDLVVDLMAGGGSTLDAASFLERHCLAYDLQPARPEVKQHDAMAKLPSEVKKVQIFFFDPPYGSIAKGFYGNSANCLSQMGEEDFLEALNQIANRCRPALLPQGYLAIIVQNVYNWEHNTVFALAEKLLANDWTMVRRIQVPLATQHISSSVMKWAKENRQMVNIDRDLLIFQKK
jgi:DNA modification methylase